MVYPSVNKCFRLLLPLMLTVISFSTLTAAPNAQEILERFEPIQSGVDYDQPTQAQAAEAELESIKIGSAGPRSSNSNVDARSIPHIQRFM